MKRVLAVFFAVSVAAAALADSGFKLKSGDRVLFYGDSITEQHLYTNFVETFVVARFQNLNVSFRNTGVGGDRVGGGWAGPIDVRMTRDFLPYKPTVATIMLGMNDASYRPFDQGIFDTFAKGYASILTEVKQKLPGCRVMPILPSPYDDYAHKPNWNPGYNAVLVQYGQYLKDLAAKNGLETIDLNTGVVEGLQKAFSINPKLAEKLMPDRVHPTPQCQLLMAAEVLKAWGAPATVTDVSIDLAARKVGKASHTKVSLGEGMTWTQLDEGLPFPLSMDDPLVALVVQSSDFVEKLDREMLSVTGLTGTRYALKIDGKTVGEFSPAALESGINLAVLKTPMVEQAAKVKLLTDRHNEIFMARWRNVQMPFSSDHVQFNSEAGMTKAMAGLEALEDEAVKAQHAAAKPVLHTYELVVR
jgi:lysophospholipase L1-like esterase